jgi:hypothetical protein
MSFEVLKPASPDLLPIALGSIVNVDLVRDFDNAVQVTRRAAVVRSIVEDGAAAGRQDSGQEQNREALVGGAREGGSERLQEAAHDAKHGTGQRGGAARPSAAAALLGLAALAALLVGLPGLLHFLLTLASGYSSHRSRWVRDQGLSLPLIPPQRLVFV